MLVAHSQLEESTPQVGAILHHELDYRKQFCFWRTVFHLSVAQHLTAIFNGTENCTPIPFLFLQLCSGEASVSRTYMTFSVGIPELSLRTAPALCSGRLSAPFHSIRTSSLCCASGAVSGSLCLRIFYECSMKYSQILGCSSTACPFWGPSMLTQPPPQPHMASCHAIVPFSPVLH